MERYQVEFESDKTIKPIAVFFPLRCMTYLQKARFRCRTSAALNRIQRQPDQISQQVFYCQQLCRKRKLAIVKSVKADVSPDEGPTLEMSAYKLGGQFTFSTQLLTLYYLLYSPTDAAPQFFPETYPICSFGKISSQPHTIVK